MEKTETWEKKSVISQITQGMELANVLKRKLHPSTNPREDCGFLVEGIVSRYDNAIALLTHGDSTQIIGVSNELIEGSPRSEVSVQDFKDNSNKDVNKKRKTLSSWSKQVIVCSETEFGGQLYDGYYWRKYGQKDILGANHPRAYYRCTHRHTQGCSATKQVQQMDKDPSQFEIVYRGNHSCTRERVKHNKVNVAKEEEANAKVEKLEVVRPKEENNVESENVESSSSRLLSPGKSESYLSDKYFPEIDFDFLVDQMDFDSHLLDAADYL